MSKYVLAYGSLRVGMGNYRHYFDGSNHIKTITLQGYDMLNTNYGYPVVVEGQGSIVCDLLKVTDEQFDRANSMEVGAGYIPTEIGILEVGVGSRNATLWVYDPLSRYKPVKDGDWVKYINERDTHENTRNSRS